MQSEDPVRHGSEEVRPSAEPLPQHADAVPLVQTTTNAPRRRRLQELLQHHAQRPGNS